MTDLAIVIVNWNTRDLLRRSLASVYSTVSGLQFEVYVVDNGSSDSSAEMVRNEYPLAHLVESSVNLGFARANNLVLRDSDATTVLLLNPDAMLTEGTVAEMYGVLTDARSSSVAAVGPQLLNEDGTNQESWGTFPSLRTEFPSLGFWTRRYGRGSETGSSYNGLDLVDWITGAALMVRKEALDQVGLLDEGYWLYTEETDWCFRAHKLGWRIGFLPHARVYHVRRASSKQVPARSLISYHESRLRFLEKHRGGTQAWCARLILCLKSSVWLLLPRISPLSKAMPQVGMVQVRQAYLSLLGRLLKWPQPSV